MDGKTDDGGGGGYSGVVSDQHAAGGALAPYAEDAEGEWAAMAVATAGLAPGDAGRPACRVPREPPLQQPEPRPLVLPPPPPWQ